MVTIRRKVSLQLSAPKCPLLIILKLVSCTLGIPLAVAHGIGLAQLPNRLIQEESLAHQLIHGILPAQAFNLVLQEVASLLKPLRLPSSGVGLL